MAIGIKIVAVGSSGFLATPEWVVEFDPDAGRTEYPTGWLTTDADPSKALQFTSKTQAFMFYQQQSTTVPYRPDGRPNRPLTAFTVEVEEIPE